jgi:hypothetical protein
MDYLLFGVAFMVFVLALYLISLIILGIGVYITLKIIDS